MKQNEAVELLSQCDHGFLSKEGANKITEPFGFECATYLAKSSPDEFKGLTLHDEKGNPVNEMEGQDADKIATQICDHLGLKYPPMFGKGTQLAVCIIALNLYLKTTAQI